MGFTRGERNQAFLLPPDTRDWLPENHTARFAALAVDQKPLSSFRVSHHRGGRK